MLVGFEFELSRSWDVQDSNEDTDTRPELEVGATSNHVNERPDTVGEETGIGVTTTVEATIPGVSDNVVAPSAEVAEEVELYKSEIPVLPSLDGRSLED